MRVIIIWSITVITLHLLPLCNALIAMASGPLISKLILPALLILYVSLIPICWLIICAQLVRKMPSLEWTLFLWTFLFWGYLLISEFALLMPFGQCEGYLFMNPLVPIANIPAFLAPLHYVEIPLTLLWFCCITSTLYGVYASSDPRYTALVLFFIGAWLLCIPFKDKKDTPNWLHKVGHLPISFSLSIGVENGQKIIFHELNKLYDYYPSLALVISPESAWNNALLTHQKKLDWLIDHPIKNIIIGGFSKNGFHHFNSMYWYYKGNKIRRHDKRQALPFTERITGEMFTFYTALYFNNTSPITSSKEPRLPFLIPEVGPFTPYICSELFCATIPDNDSHHPLLMIANDSWFMSHFQRLMVLGARLRAIQWHQPLLYISFHYAQYFDQEGTAFRIATTPPSRFIG